MSSKEKKKIHEHSKKPTLLTIPMKIEKHEVEDDSVSDDESVTKLPEGCPTFQLNSCALCEYFSFSMIGLIEHVETAHSIKKSKDYILGNIITCKKCNFECNDKEQNGFSAFLGHIAECKKKRNRKPKKQTEKTLNNTIGQEKRKRGKGKVPFRISVSAESSPTQTQRRKSQRLEEKTILALLTEADKTPTCTKELSHNDDSNRKEGSLGNSLASCIVDVQAAVLLPNSPLDPIFEADSPMDLSEELQMSIPSLVQVSIDPVNTPTDSANIVPSNEVTNKVYVVEETNLLSGTSSESMVGSTPRTSKPSRKQKELKRLHRTSYSSIEPSARRSLQFSADKSTTATTGKNLESSDLTLSEAKEDLPATDSCMEDANLDVELPSMDLSKTFQIQETSQKNDELNLNQMETDVTSTNPPPISDNPVLPNISETQQNLEHLLSALVDDNKNLPNDESFMPEGSLACNSKAPNDIALKGPMVTATYSLFFIPLNQTSQELQPIPPASMYPNPVNQNHTKDKRKTFSIPANVKRPRGKWIKQKPKVSPWFCSRCKLGFGCQKVYMSHSCGVLKVPVCFQ